MNDRPIVYIASPYTLGNQELNARFQCKVWDDMMNEGLVLPFAPLWSHFHHLHYPRHYQDWVDYDLALLTRFDACLRLDASFPAIGYRVSQSSGADGEVEAFRKMNKPVFFDKDSLYGWVKERGVKTENGGQVQFDTGAVRSSDAEGARFDLVSPIGLRRVAEACNEGAAKYGDYNWEKGMPIGDLLNHAIQHLYKYLSGDRSEDHLGHAAWGCMAACHSEESWPQLNTGLRPLRGVKAGGAA